MATSPELRELADRVRNWGRWGDDDQAGTVNLIDAAAVQRGAACVRNGNRFSLAVQLREDGVQMGQPAGRLNPLLTPTSLNERDQFAPGIWEGTDDFVAMSTCAGTHVDAISHIGYEGQLYGGRDQYATIKARGGASELGAEQIPPVATRGILIDVPRTRGVEELEVGTAVTADDLQAAVDAAGIEVAAGDALCVRTGEIRQYHRGEKARYATGENWATTGLGLSCVEWVHAHDIAAVFIDCYTYEVMPPESGNWDDLLAVHMLQLRDMGMMQGQNWDFEALAADRATSGTADFLLVVAPEPIVGATSAPVNPVAIT
jgi:kynurenine formamidase